MSSVVDVGDAIELTFSANTGASVTATWLDPDLVPVVEDETVPENPPGSGRYPATFLPTRAGMWTARFTASGAATANEAYFVRATVFTGPPPLAAVGDVAAQFGSLTPAQETLAGWLLRAASQIVRSRFPKVDEQIAAGRLSADMVALAVTNMVLRVMRNPGGLRSETVGPFSRSYDTTTAAGLLVLTDTDSALLEPTPEPGGAPGVVRTIWARPGLAPPPYGVRHGWW